MLPIQATCTAQPGSVCPRRTGRLLGGSTAFFAKESGGKESAEGALPLCTPPNAHPG